MLLALSTSRYMKDLFRNIKDEMILEVFKSTSRHMKNNIGNLVATRE